MTVMSFMACFSSLYTSMHMSLHCVCSSVSMRVLEVKGVEDGGINTDIYLIACSFGCMNSLSLTND